MTWNIRCQRCGKKGQTNFNHHANIRFFIDGHARMCPVFISAEEFQSQMRTRADVLTSVLIESFFNKLSFTTSLANGSWSKLEIRPGLRVENYHVRGSARLTASSVSLDTSITFSSNEVTIRGQNPMGYIFNQTLFRGFQQDGHPINAANDFTRMLRGEKL